MTFTILYFFVAAPQMNFQWYVVDADTPFGNTYKDFVQTLPFLARMYQGIATIPLACEEAKNAKVDVPRAMNSTVTLVFFLGMSIIFACCSHAPGMLLIKADFPLSFGFGNGLSIPVHIGSIFSFPAVYATCFGYAYSYGRILCAMSRSGLLPSWFATVTGERQTPIVGIILGNLAMYIVMLALYFTNCTDHSISAAALIATVFVYWSVFASFIILRVKFSNLQRVYVNPFGIPSAILGALVFTLQLTAILGYVDYNWAAVVIFMSFVIACTMYYIFFAAKTQCYSEEEQSIMLVLYVMKANKMKRNKKKKPNFVPYRPAATNSSAKYHPNGTSSSDANNTNTESGTQQTSLRLQVVSSNSNSVHKVVPINYDPDPDVQDAKVVVEDGKTTSLHEARLHFSSDALDDITAPAIHHPPSDAVLDDNYEQPKI